ncbi:hypothetical protein NDU88_006551 [Pleurodeles waltl]|uniref:Uncharacterized protein n=1 Tax=Pleurodeles waltl TaxID=8319 RepID=A0AAV7ME83_PLEWA|nr:hypothetical protein NDU88_006551 [Pleurodeles waltl]
MVPSRECVDSTKKASEADVFPPLEPKCLIRGCANQHPVVLSGQQGDDSPGSDYLSTSSLFLDYTLRNVPLSTVTHSRAKAEEIGSPDKPTTFDDTREAWNEA